MAQTATFGNQSVSEPHVHHRGWRYVAIGVAVLLLTVVGIWYFGARNASAPSSGASVPSSSAAGGTSSSGTSNNGAQQIHSYRVGVFFSKHPDSDNDPSATFPVSRTSPGIGVGTYAVAQLLVGPTAAESAQGYFTTVRLRDDVSNCGGADFTLSISNGTARLQFCKPFDHLGIVADGQADSELKATLKQFPSVQKVVILNYKGSCEFNLSGLNLCLQ